MRNLKNIIWSLLRSIIGKELYETLRAKYNLGYFPNIGNPKSFNEKLINLKLSQDTTNLSTLADKYEVRQFVKTKLGDNCLNKIYFIGNTLSQKDWDTFPKKFVIKTTHSGGGEGNIFIYDKENIDLKSIIKKINTNLKKKFGVHTNETWYMGITPRIIVEELMLDEEGNIPFDYKFFCFNGVCHFIQVDLDRFQKHTRNFYNKKWDKQNFELLYKNGPHLKKPENLEEMIAIAEKLSSNFNFVRVDLYSFNQKIRFGEMTFCPGAGWEPFKPAFVDTEMGLLWT